MKKVFKKYLKLIICTLLFILSIGCSDYFGEKIECNDVKEYGKYLGEATKNRDYEIGLENNEGISPKSIPKSADIILIGFNAKQGNPTRKAFHEGKIKL